MTEILDRSCGDDVAAGERSTLRRGGVAFAHITPNWFAAVMGTGIVATSAISVGGELPAIRSFASAIWVLAVVLLVLITVAFCAHWVRHPVLARRYVADPVMVQFYGAIPMALLTVGAGTITVGSSILGALGAVVVDAVLWSAGTLAGLGTAIGVPYLMMTHHHRRGELVALPAWLMPVVPPMVSATTGALLVEHVPSGQWRLGFLALCYLLFGLSVFLGMVTLTLIYGRLMRGGVPTGRAAPTIWITLGVIGQSVTAANSLAAHADSAFVGRTDQHMIVAGLVDFGICYGLAATGLGAGMFALATAVTVHNVRRSLPFALTWWSFTFPIGTCVTGLAALGTALDATMFRVGAAILFGVLLAAWTVVFARTVAAVIGGRLPAAA
ncbi:TDT family transporter [Gordonia aichiensis]|uniref:Putative TDT family transporter n=1 Tax=Gordonia aichiensis NBRC 108223 TaxID=1220583 RepID=L7KKJ9_9ACTN|nr:TDT family transporter [Gordonia aichiensis]GAC49134.1 putative TDT family transporter [Gordonia aichiensis NBRC 108223]